MLASNDYVIFNILVYTYSLTSYCSSYRYTRGGSSGALLVKYRVPSPDTAGRKIGNLREQFSLTTINVSSSAFLDNYHRLSTISLLKLARGPSFMKYRRIPTAITSYTPLKSHDLLEWSRNLRIVIRSLSSNIHDFIRLSIRLNYLPERAAIWPLKRFGLITRRFI